MSHLGLHCLYRSIYPNTYGKYDNDMIAEPALLPLRTLMAYLACRRQMGNIFSFHSENRPCHFTSNLVLKIKLDTVGKVFVILSRETTFVTSGYLPASQ